jgi:hypothetical protein
LFGPFDFSHSTPPRHRACMLKFWRSPTTSSKPSSASAPSNTASDRVSTSINNQPQPQLAGLGITDGDADIASGVSGSGSRVSGQEREEVERGGRRVVSRRATLEVPLEGSEGTGHGARRESMSHGVTFVDGVVDGKKSTTAGNNSRLSVATAREVRSEDFGDRRHEQYRSLSPSIGGGGGRAVSPMSFSPSIASTFHNPYGPGVGALTERDPNQIYGTTLFRHSRMFQSGKGKLTRKFRKTLSRTAPTTWSDMAHQDLVVNLSARERTRQEILWEVVASEERCVTSVPSVLDSPS